MGVTMNCIPGDLAVLVRNTSGIGCYDQLIGLPITVDAVITDAPRHGPIWRKRGDAVLCPNCRAVLMRNFIDADLQPLRPKGNSDQEPRDVMRPVRQLEFTRA